MDLGQKFDEIKEAAGDKLQEGKDKLDEVTGGGDSEEK